MSASCVRCMYVLSLTTGVERGAVHTCMDQLALTMQVVQAEQYVSQAVPEEDLGPPPRRISPEQVAPAIPHGQLDEALVLPS